MTATQMSLLTDTRPVTLRQRVADYLLRHPEGATDWEITVGLGLAERRKPSVAKRRGELYGCVALMRSDGETVTRMSPDGQPCNVWTLANPAGRAAAARLLHPSGGES